MIKFIYQHTIRPFAKQWWRGIILLLLWTVAFVALPAISGWFLAMCSLAFATANRAFSYMIPQAIIRFIALLRTFTRYFERIQNHTTTLSIQQRLQLRIFASVARLPYIKKQMGNNSAYLENSTSGIEQILNYIQLWLLPLVGILFAISVSSIWLSGILWWIAVEFIVSSALLLFVIPQFYYRRNARLYGQLKQQKQDNHQNLMETFRGSIEIEKYNLKDKALNEFSRRLKAIERTEDTLHTNNLNMQLIAGFGMSVVAVAIFAHLHHTSVDVPTAIGIFFGILAQAELAEILFSGKSERTSVMHQVADLQQLFDEADSVANVADAQPRAALTEWHVKGWQARIPNTSVSFATVSFSMKQGECLALYGETGTGKSTLLHSLFFSEYKMRGEQQWNNQSVNVLVPPSAIYVTQKAYLLTGTLKENFQGYEPDQIRRVIDEVNLSDWFEALPHGLDTWLGENGETLSGGQRKKLLLAQALLKTPDLLVIDEPTAGISTENALDIFRTIRTRYPQMTILMATHERAFERVVNQTITI